MDYKYLIIGQGLAGSMLSYALWKKGISFLVIDEESPFSASSVAGGIYNPVTGRRMVKSWRVDEFLPVMENSYRELEILLNAKFLNPRPILKVIANSHEMAVFEKKKQDPETMAFMGACLDYVPSKNIKPFAGCCEILGGGSLNVSGFISSYRNFLKSINSFRAESLDHSKIELNEKHIVYKNITAEKLIFCEGYKASALNPFFNYLPFNNVKGEILTIRIPGMDENYIINKGLLLAPLGNGLFSAGATYNWDDLTDLSTKQGKEELIAKLDELLAIPYTILSQNAGIRPATQDRRPFLGFHPHYEQLAIFNGLGTKGVLLAPWLAGHFANVLEGQQILDKELDIKRCKTHFAPK